MSAAMDVMIGQMQHSGGDYYLGENDALRLDLVGTANGIGVRYPECHCG